MMSHSRELISWQHIVGSIALAILALSGCASMSGQAPASSESKTVGTGADWPMYAGSYAGERFSRLDQITVHNIANLHQVCAFETGDMGSFQGGPIVVDGVLYLTIDTATFAIDGASCALRWKHVYEYQPRSWLGNNHGAAYLGGRLFRASGDGHAYAIDAATGRMLWNVAVANAKAGESLPMAPIAWSGMVFIGTAGGDSFGVTGHVFALSAEDGHTLWRSDVIPAKGPVRATWTKASAANPPTGGGMWTSYALDPGAGLLYVPTGNVAPDFAAALHPGPSLYATSLLAIDVRTGFVAGYVQPVKNDSHDHDVSAAPALVTTRGGKQMALTAAKDGFLYGIDRSGVRREDAVATDVAVAPESLLIRYRSQTTTRDNLNEPMSSDHYVHFCPGALGGTEWNGPAFDPATNTVFVAAVDWCASVKLADPATLQGKTGEAWTGVTIPTELFGKFDPPEKWGGWLNAFDADTGALLWKYHSPTPIQAAVTATAGGLVFTGDLEGNVIAFDIASGKELWRGQAGQPLAAGIVTYSAGGRQFVAAAGGAVSALWPVKSGSSRVAVFGLQ